jgi:hypothetical protein
VGSGGGNSKNVRRKPIMGNSVRFKQSIQRGDCFIRRGKEEEVNDKDFIVDMLKSLPPALAMFILVGLVVLAGVLAFVGLIVLGERFL